MPTLLFDLDDTIITFDSVAEQAWHEACEKYIHNFPELSLEKLYQQILECSREYWSDPERHREGRLDLRNARREVMAHTLKNLETESPHGNDLADFYSIRREELAYLFPNAIETLELFKKKGYRMGLLTNGAAETQRQKIDRFKLEPYFETILIEGELGFGKPDSRVYQKALADLNAIPEDTWMVGDNLIWDVAGAQAVGITGIWNDWNKKGLPANSEIKPDRIIHSIAELANEL